MPTSWDPNAGGVGSNAASANPQTPSYTFPPGAVPYGSPPSMTTVLRDDASSQGEPSDALDLEFEKLPNTTASTSIMTDFRWQRIRPVAIW
ncbi:hypothetical protein F4821DRAFT_237801 [Hypoxylon rubiginosum]|uniref:Uncharacterized protein n=1 Tax=Hypoxylon rubiginosum TaxID=110542 RepID=A0ACC0D2G8_9PEZI|nr:hypothetical protein F4821DRAFT_237801 [Hypoxylon rubiginosum]